MKEKNANIKFDFFPCRRRRPLCDSFGAPIRSRRANDVHCAQKQKEAIEIGKRKKNGIEENIYRFAQDEWKRTLQSCASR